MTTLELKIEIHKRIDNLPDSALPKLLDYIKSVSVSPDVDKIIDKIIKEEAALLKRLAE